MKGKQHLSDTILKDFLNSIKNDAQNVKSSCPYLLELITYCLIQQDLHLQSSALPTHISTFL